MPPSLPVEESAFLARSQADIAEFHPELRGPCVPPRTAPQLADWHWGWGWVPRCPPGPQAASTKGIFLYLLPPFIVLPGACSLPFCSFPGKLAKAASSSSALPD